MKIEIFVIVSCLLSFIRLTDPILVDIPEEIVEKLQRMANIQEEKANGIWIDYVLHPEKFDLNKDRRISQLELCDAIFTGFFFDKQVEKLEKTVLSFIKQKIRQFVISLKHRFINYKQMSFITYKLSDKDVYDINDIMRLQASLIEKREIENDL